MKQTKKLSFLEYLDWLSDNWSVFQSSDRRSAKPTLPGAVLEKDYLTPRSISQSKLAAKIGCTHAKVNEIVNGKRGITPEFAIDLEQALGVSADFWISLQSNYDLWMARQKRKSDSSLRTKPGN